MSARDDKGSENVGDGHSAACVPPGSGEALDLGCLCPVIDNGRGRGYLGGLEDEEGKTMFVVNFECPLHGVPTAKGEQVVAR